MVTQAFSQNLKSGCPKCAIRPAQMSNLQGNMIMKNKTIFLRKWPSTGCLDTHLAKSLLLITDSINLVHIADACLWLCCFMVVVNNGLYFVNRGQCRRLSGRLLVSEGFSDVLA